MAAIFNFEGECVAMGYDADADPVGIIEGKEGSPIRLDDWVARIDGDARLRRPDQVRATDPLSGKPLTISPHPGTAYVWESAAPIGLMTWSEEGLDEIVVYGALPRVISVAEEVAQHLGGRFRPLDLD
jgi:hypothetical protein